ncbi:polysaccharide lyase family 7 protein [Flavobacterium sp. UMI-01]|uniref:polysaccharide lyase family 7 protein n=1 Tax=Flavobacterium sp. UMI-01 TaxID=1441053 RepID=UPI001C7CD39A|nr:polysaccharide lyase family 7 protein [Flavobacterium sp. UMI-01]
MKSKNYNLTLFLSLCMLLLCISHSTVAQVPADLMRNCKQWYITYPTGKNANTICNEPNNEFYYVNKDKNAITFRVPIRSDNGTTPNTRNIRSELREKTADGKENIFWTTEGTHQIYVKQAITHLPLNRPRLVATQIHGDKTAGIDDAMVMRLDGKKLYLCFNGGKLHPNVTIKSDYVLGTVHEVIFKIVDGKHYCYYSEDGKLLSAYKKGKAARYLIKDGNNDFVMDKNYDKSYFKVGNYTQSNPTDEGDLTGDPNNYGEVVVYDFDVDHSGKGFTTAKRSK